MAKETVVIELKENGSREVKRNLKEVGDTAKAAGSNTQFLKNALVGLGFVALARQAIGLADSYTALNNRLRSLTTSEENLIALQRTLLDVANKTGDSVESTVRLYAQLADSTKSLGLNQVTLVSLTETLNNVFELSGSASGEAAQGLRRFITTLSDGRVAGLELNLVLKQLPNVADALAAALGTTRDGLKQLADEGKITSAVLINALLDAGGAIQEQADKNVTSVAKAITVFRNQVEFLIASVDRATGATQALVNAILFVAENVETFARVVLAGILAKAIDLVIGSVKKLTLAIKANPVGLLVSGALLAVSALISFSDQISVTADGAVKLSDVFAVLFDGIRDGLVVFAAGFQRVFGPTLTTLFGKVEFSLEGILRTAASVFDGIVGFGTGAAAALLVVFTAIPEEISIAVRQNTNVVIRGVNFLIRTVVQALNNLFAEVQEFSRELPSGFQLNLPQLIAPQIDEFKLTAEEEFGGAGATAAEAFKIGFNKSTGGTEFVDTLIKKAREKANVPPPTQGKETEVLEGEKTRAEAIRLTEAQRDAAAELSAELAFEKNMIALTDSERRVAIQLRQAENQLTKAGIDLTGDEGAAIRDNIEAQIREVEALRAKQDVLDEINGPERDRIARLQTLNELLVEGKINEEQYSEAVRQTNEQYFKATGFLDALEHKFTSIQLSAVTLGEGIGDILVGAVDKLSDAVAEFAISGFRDFQSFKEALSGLLRDIGKEILKLIIKFLILKAIQTSLNALGGLGGSAAGAGSEPVVSSVDTGAIADIGRAAGGPVTGGRPVLVGENGPEIFTPPQSGTIVPNSQIGGQQVGVTVINVLSQEEISAHINSSEGQKTILNVIQRNRKEIAATIGA